MGSMKPAGKGQSTTLYIEKHFLQASPSASAILPQKYNPYTSS